MILLPIFFFFGNLSEWQMKETGIYQALTSSRVAISPDAIFLLNAREQEILAYNKAGTSPKRISRKGEGPGELNQVNRIVFHNGKVFTVSPHKIQYFDSSGKYLGEMIRSRRMGGMFKSERGWVNAPFIYTPKTPEIILYDEDLTQKKTLASWETDQKIKKIDGKRIRTYSVYSQTILNSELTRLFLWRSDLVDTIQVFELKNGSALPSISLTKKEYYQKGLMNIPNAHLSQKSDSDLTQLLGIEDFGILAPAPDNKIYWFLSQSQTRALVLDSQGNQHQAEFTAKELSRIAGQEKGFLYIITQLETEELSLAKVKRNKAKAFLIQNRLDMH